MTEQLVRQILKLLKCEDPGAEFICSKDEKTENPLLVPIWVKLDINHSLKRWHGCLWLEGLKLFPNITSLILANTRRGEKAPTGGTFCVITDETNLKTGQVPGGRDTRLCSLVLATLPYGLRVWGGGRGVSVCVCVSVYSLWPFSLLNYLRPGKVNEAAAAGRWVTCY